MVRVGWLRVVHGTECLENLHPALCSLPAYTSLDRENYEMLKGLCEYSSPVQCE